MHLDVVRLLVSLHGRYFPAGVHGAAGFCYSSKILHDTSVAKDLPASAVGLLASIPEDN